VIIQYEFVSFLANIFSNFPMGQTQGLPAVDSNRTCASERGDGLKNHWRRARAVDVVHTLDFWDRHSHTFDRGRPCPLPLHAVRTLLLGRHRQWYSDIDGRSWKVSGSTKEGHLAYTRRCRWRSTLSLVNADRENSSNQVAHSSIVRGSSRASSIEHAST